MTWHSRRFDENPKWIGITCSVCSRSMWFPPSKAHKYKTCGTDECRVAAKRAEMVARTRPCETCGAAFTPRAVQLLTGHGRYCSQACNTAARTAMLAPESRARAVAGFKDALATGRYVPATGASVSTWKGGEAARRKRDIESGVSAARNRRWRKENPEKVREFHVRRKSKKIGKLPRGTVARIGEAQRWKCAACAVSIRKIYHVDHREPLARGGKHEPLNIQLLCPACNVRKSAKDPIQFMQERGFLL